MGRGRLPADSVFPWSRLDPCDSQPCQHGGTCVPEGLGKYHCLCPVRYGGDSHCGRCKPVLFLLPCWLSPALYGVCRMAIGTTGDGLQPLGFSPQDRLSLFYDSIRVGPDNHRGPFLSGILCFYDSLMLVMAVSVPGTGSHCSETLWIWRAPVLTVSPWCGCLWV